MPQLSERALRHLVPTGDVLFKMLHHFLGGLTVEVGPNTRTTLAAVTAVNVFVDVDVGIRAESCERHR